MSELAAGLSGWNVALFQTRHGDALEGLVRKAGGAPSLAEVLVEVELDPNPDAERFAERLKEGSLDALVVLTGVGQRRLAHQLESHYPGDALREAFSSLWIAARGPKALRALRERNVRVDAIAPEPFTWEGLLEVMREKGELRGKRIALQLYGKDHPRLVAGLEAEGAEVWPLWVYRWQLPDDVSPARALIDRILAGEMHMALFTSAPQVTHLLRIAALDDREQALRQALARMPIGSVGPTCSEGIVNEGLTPAFEPEHGKMGHLVKQAGLWAAKNPR